MLANKQKNDFFSKISNANLPLLGLIKTIARKPLLQCLTVFVNLAKSGSRVMAKTALKSRSRLLQYLKSRMTFSHL